MPGARDHCVERGDTRRIIERRRDVGDEAAHAIQIDVIDVEDEKPLDVSAIAIRHAAALYTAATRPPCAKFRPRLPHLAIFAFRYRVDALER